MKREVSIKRKTNEVEITGLLNVDGTGKSEIKTGLDFLDHMLTLFSFFGFFDLKIKAQGDLSHHANEDIAICMGKAFSQAVGDGAGIKRFGCAFCPMDKTLARCVVDISGRPSFHFSCDLAGAAEIPDLNGYSIEQAKHFLEAFANSARINIQVDARFDGDTHHFIEAVFKAFGIALDTAAQIDPRRGGVSSTKGILDLQ